MTPLEWPGVTVDLRRRLVSRQGEPDRALTTKECALLEWLAAHSDRVASRDDLLREVWGYAPTVVSRACDNAIARLRSKLEADPAHPEILVTVHGGGYRLLSQAPVEEVRLPPKIDSDAPRFVTGGRTVDLRRGGVEGPGGLVALTGREIEVLRHLYEAGGASVDRDVLQRAVWGSAAGRALEHAVSRLRRKLEADPSSPAGLVTTARGYRLQLDGSEPTSPLARPPPALPEELDRRVGREDVVDAIVAALDEVRLLTILGLGGAGKTRTALACAQVLTRRGASVFWVDLVATRSPDALLHATARVVGVDASATDLVGAIAAALEASPRPVLVLDNLEQIDEAAVAVVGLLERARSARILATSRVPLKVRAERRWPLPALAHDEAVALFLERSPRSPNPGEQVLVDAIVSGVSELPLAVELAAARTRVLSFGELAKRLAAARPSVLSSSERDRPSRHASLRAALRDTFAMLPEPVGQALAQLTVFEGGFTLVAAEAVLDLGAEPPWMPDVLQELVEAQLLRSDDAGLRWALPVVVRDHAAELLDAKATAAAHGRHAAAFAAMARSLPAVLGLQAFRDLAADLDNFEVACRRALRSGDPTVAVGAALGVWAVLERRGPYSAATPLLREVAASARSASDVAWANTALGEALARTGAFAEAYDAFSLAADAPAPACRGRARVGRARASISLARPGDTEVDLVEASALPGFASRVALVRGLAERRQERLGAAVEALEEAARAAAREDDARLEAEARAELGNTLAALNSPEADRQHQRALRLSEQVDDAMIVSRVHLSRVWDLVGRDPSAAVQPLLELAEWLRSQGATSREVWCLLTSANGALAVGDLETAEAALQRVERRELSAQNRAQLDRLRAVLLSKRGAPDEAARSLEKALGGARARNDLAATFMIGSELADVLRRLGRYDEARELGTTALAFVRDSGRTLQQGEVMLLLGNIARDAGDQDGAAGWFRGVAELARAAGLERLGSAAAAALAAAPPSDVRTV